MHARHVIHNGLAVLEWWRRLLHLWGLTPTMEVGCALINSEFGVAGGQRRACWLPLLSRMPALEKSMVSEQGTKLR